MDVVDPKDPIRIPYCGPKNMRPLTAYAPFKDLNVGDFMLMRLHDLDLVPLWMEKAKGDVIKGENNEYFKMVKVQWWVFVKKGSNLDERYLYEDCWNGKWKCNLAYQQQWLDISTNFFSFPSRKITNKSQISIPATYASKV